MIIDSLQFGLAIYFKDLSSSAEIRTKSWASSWTHMQSINSSFDTFNANSRNKNETAILLAVVFEE